MGCGSAPQRHHPAQPSLTSAHRQLVFGASSLPANFNPLTPQGATRATRQTMAQIWPSPFIITPQFSPTINYAFVSSAELVSVNPETIVYQINPKAKWSDGVPISVDDFIYNWHAQSGDPSYRDVGGMPYSVNSTLGYSDIASIVGSNNGKQVKVIFKSPFSDWESLFDPLVPAHVAQKYGWNSGFTTYNPAIEVSGGPYEISSVSSQQVVLSVNPNYWGTPPQIDQVILRLDPNADQYANQLATDQIQVVETPGEVNVLQQIDGLANVAQPVQLTPTLGFEELDFNQNDPTLAKLLIRQAIANYTDRNALIAAGPGQMALSGPIPQEDDNHIYVPAQSGQYQPNGSAYDSPHPNLAARQLVQAGYVQGSDNMWHADTKTGPVLSFSLLADESDPILEAVAETFVSQMKASGIEVNLVNQSATQIDNSLLSGSWQLALVTQHSSPFPASFATIYSDPQLLAPTSNTTTSSASIQSGQSTTTTSAASGSTGKPLNYFGYNNTLVDQLFSKAITNPDLFDASEDYNMIDTQLWSDMVSLPIYEDLEIVANTMDVNGVLANPSNSTIFWNLNQWTMTTDLRKQGK